VNRVKGLSGCADCGRHYHPAVLDFHHLEPEDKQASVGDMIRNAGMERLKAEIRKCVLLCANCHRMRELKARRL
jgi:hypothetical protein